MTKPRIPMFRCIPVTRAQVARMNSIAHSVSNDEVVDYVSNAEQVMRDGNSAVLLLLNNTEPMSPTYGLLHGKLIVSDFLKKFNGINT